MTVIYETGTAPRAKERYRVEVLTRGGEWREVDDTDREDFATTWADLHAREERTKARVVDAQTTDLENRS